MTTQKHIECTINMVRAPINGQSFPPVSEAYRYTAYVHEYGFILQIGSYLPVTQSPALLAVSYTRVI